jgi:putative PIN family toxin of toxin-antitoxin system
MQVVVDTNIIVSGLMTGRGNNASIIDMIFTGQVTPVYDQRIINEYEDVLNRKKFSFRKEDIDNVLEVIKYFGVFIIPERVDRNLPDPYDACFYECALMCQIPIIITGNKKHFPEDACKDVKIFNSGEFIKFILDSNLY